MLALTIGVIAGIAATVQPSVNAEARKFFRSSLVTAIQNFALAWLLLAAFLIFTEHGLNIPLKTAAGNPPWIWGGGFCAIIIVVTNILCVPKLGSAGNVMVMNFSQIIAGLVIDHFALFGTEAVRMSFTRTVGGLLVLAGLMLVTREKGEGDSEIRTMPPFYFLLALISGTACAVQIAVNGTLSVVVDSAAKATLISMSVAFMLTLLVIAMILLFKGKQGLFEVPEEEREPFRLRNATGGLLSVTIVCGNAFVAPVLGTGLSAITNLIGMIGSGLVIDATGFLGIEKKPVTFRKVAGMVLMLAGTALISFL